MNESEVVTKPDDSELLSQRNRAYRNSEFLKKVDEQSGRGVMSSVFTAVLKKVDPLTTQAWILLVLLSVIQASTSIALVVFVEWLAVPVIAILVLFELTSIKLLAKEEPEFIKDSVYTKRNEHSPKQNMQSPLFAFYPKVEKEIGELFLLRLVQNNPGSSLYELALAARVHEKKARAWVEDLLHQKLIKNDSEGFLDVFSIDFENNYKVTVHKMRQLTALEEIINDIVRD